jgi:hypothetical protein
MEMIAVRELRERLLAGFRVVFAVGMVDQLRRGS